MIKSLTNIFVLFNVSTFLKNVSDRNVCQNVTYGTLFMTDKVLSKNRDKYYAAEERNIVNG